MSSTQDAILPDAQRFQPGPIAYWIAAGLSALAFVVPGILNLVHAPHMARDIAHLGYPPYFQTILGTWKLLGALAIVLPGRPRLKEWAYAGMMFDLTGAVISRAAMGDEALMILVPLAIAGIVAASWALRPADRRLAALPACRLVCPGGHS